MSAQFPLDFHIDPLVVPSHLIFDLLAFYSAFAYYTILRKNHGDYLSTEKRILLRPRTR